MSTALKTFLETEIARGVRVMSPVAQLKNLMTESKRVWREVVSAGGDPLVDARWSALAEAEGELREANGWTYQQTGIRNFMPRGA